ncbi:MAG TPA: 1-phosphofructokinase family hexose kinase, partial [Gammaproteobacteria bacterium]|nr:1-phosphofructokinase family hexose kinase [Gammaproteobacteria bacterium]
QGGVTWICVSLGEEGALLTGPDNSYFAPAPKVTVYSSVGAGDSMVGALVAAFSRSISAREGLRLGVACATGTVTHPGTELFSPDDVQCYFDDIQVRSLDI